MKRNNVTTRRRRPTPWKALPSPTTMAKQLWAHLFPDEPWPKGYRIEWCGWMRGALGLHFQRERRILLSYGDARQRDGTVIETLMHEFVHVRGFHRHNREFVGVHNALRARLGLPAWPTAHRSTVGAGWRQLRVLDPGPYTPRVACVACDTVWDVPLQPSGFVPGWERCPRGCAAPEVAAP